MSEAAKILDAVRDLTNARTQASKPIDYAAANKMFRRQKTALTRAQNSGNPDAVITACWKTVREWESTGTPWPDSWANWDIAFGDAAYQMGYDLGLRLEDLARIPDSAIDSFVKTGASLDDNSDQELDL